MKSAICPQCYRHCCRIGFSLEFKEGKETPNKCFQYFKCDCGAELEIKNIFIHNLKLLLKRGR